MAIDIIMLFRPSGGGGSHQRTRLCAPFPCFAGKYREIRRFQPEEDHNPPCSQWKFNGLSVTSLSGKTGKISALSGNENWITGNVQPTASRGTVHIAPAKLATHHRL